MGAPGTARHTRAERLTTALIDRLWNPAEGMFFSRDVRTETLIPERSVSGLLPLLLPTLPRPVVTALVRTTASKHFGLGGTTRLAPSYDLLGEAFDRHRYWRGPAWVNVNWLVAAGLSRIGHPELADRRAAATVDLVASAGFREYFDPCSGDGFGSRDFTWTAALVADLLSGARPAS